MFEKFSLIPLQSASQTHRYIRYSMHQVFEELFRRDSVAWPLSVKRFLGFLCNELAFINLCGRHRPTVQACLHKRNLSRKESSSADLLGRASGAVVEVLEKSLLAGGYEAQVYGSSLGITYFLTASKRSAEMV